MSVQERNVNKYTLVSHLVA